jgi:hypothetical protein
MERSDLDATEAFALLIESSQETNLKLVDVARWLVGEVEARRVSRTERRPSDDGQGNAD